MIRSGRLALLALALVSTLRAQSAESPAWVERLNPTVSVDTAWVENISRTSYEPTRKEAATFGFDLAGTLARQLAPSVLAIGSAELSALAVRGFGLANHTDVAARATLQKKFGLGPQAWVFQAGVSGGYKAARFAGDRGFDTEANVQLSKRVLPNLRLVAGARWQEHDARSATFDLDQSSRFVEAQWDLGERWALSGEASRLRGDIVANAAWPIWTQALAGAFGPTVSGYYSSRPWSVTQLYGPGWVSYNVEADVDLWSVALSYACSDRAAIELRYRSVYVVNDAGVAYPGRSSELRWNYRF